MSAAPSTSPATGGNKLDAAVDEACRICHRPLQPGPRTLFDTRFGIPNLFALARCSGCGLEQTCPRLLDAELTQLYERYYNYGGERQTLQYSRWRERFLFSGWYRMWMRLDGDLSFHSIRGRGRLLDVGCNEGRGLMLYRANGYQAEGLEINPAAAEVARARGFAV